MHARTLAPGCLCLLACLAVGCAATHSGTSDSPDDGGGGGRAGAGGSSSSGSPGSAGSSGSAGAQAGEQPPPPEIEETVEVEAPKAGARFVYVANPKRDTVAVIDSMSLSIRSVDAGDTPTYLATAPGQDLAIALNVDSRDATVLRTDAAGVTRTTTVPLFTTANAIAMAPDGRHAVVWFDTSRVRGRISAADLQAVSLVTFDPAGDTSIPLTVGFQPNAVSFAADGSAAFIITDDGVSVARFASVAGRQVLKPLPVGASTATGVRPDVSVTPDGRFAVSRTEGQNTVRLVDLTTGAEIIADLGGAVTDLDLSPDGKLAFAVLRDGNATVRLPIPAGFSDPGARVRKEHPGETVGSAALSPDGKWAILYTTASDVERIVIEDLATGVASPVRLRKTVKAVTFSPTSAAAIVVHRKSDGNPDDPGIPLDLQIARSAGYSIVDLASKFARLQLTPTDLGPLAFTPDGVRAFLLLRDDRRSLRAVHRIDLTSLFVDELTLGSPPLALGALAASHRMFVSQAHPEGRLTFIDWITGETSSVTGFELNGRIVE